MIARIWHGVVPESKSDQYYRYMDKTGFANYKASPGFVDLRVLRKVKDGMTHFLVLTLWDGYDSIIQFAGKDYQRAKYYPEDKDYLIELEEYVDHYQVAYHG